MNIQEELDKIPKSMTVEEKWQERISNIDVGKVYTDLTELKVVDAILCKSGGLGFVIKINPKNVTYETTYRIGGETELVELKTPKDNINVFKKPKV